MKLIPDIRLGNGNTPLLFSHANAYHPLCYNKFLSSLDIKYTIFAPLHRPLWQKEIVRLQNWDLFVNDLIDYCDQQNISNIDAIGHSLGAVCLWKAKLKRPDLIGRLVMIDPVILPKRLVRFNRFMPFYLKKKIVPIIKRAINRRMFWPTQEEIVNHYKRVSVFKSFHPDSFQDFMQHGFVQHSMEGHTLAFSREWESRIYGGVENVWKFMQKDIQNATIIRAEYSDVIDEHTWKIMPAQMPNVTFIQMQGVTHMLPMEKPEELATLVTDILARPV